MNNNTKRILSKRPDGKNADSYPRANMNGKEYKIHRLVAEYFVENPNPKRFNIVNHMDGNKKNNLYTNLEWCDQLHNARHAWSMGLCPIPEGELNGRSILKEEDVLLIWSTDMPVKEISEKYGLTLGTAEIVRNKGNWHHLKPKFYEMYGTELEEKFRVKRKEEGIRKKSKFTDKEIQDIYNMAHDGVPYKKIMDIYKISDGTINQIKHKKSKISQLVLDGYIHNP